MKRRRILLLLALAAVAIAAGFVLFSPRGPKEPVWCDVPISEWIAAAEHDPEGENGLLGRRAILAIGTNALPYYMAQFTEHDSTWTARFNHWLSKQDVVDFRFHSKRSTDWQFVCAAHGLRLLGTNATPALPILANYLADSQKGFDATWAMSGCGERALPYFLAGTESTNTQTVIRSVGGLGLLAEHSESALSSLIRMLEHTNREVREAAAAELSGKVSQPDLAVRALIKALSDPDPFVQRSAAGSLGQFKEVAKPAVPSLLGLLSNTNAFVAAFASNALRRIDPAALPQRGP